MDIKTLQKIKDKSSAVASLLKTMAHAERLFILCNLLSGEKNVSELLADSSLSQSAFSQHLAVLRKEGLVKTRKVSQEVYYSLADPRIKKIIELLKQLYC